MQHLRAVPDAAPLIEATEPTTLEAQLAEAHRKIEHLETALTTARTISMAVGVLMATFKLPSESAFDMLVVASQNTRRKLRDIAAEVVETGTLNWGRDMTPALHESARRSAGQVEARPAEMGATAGQA